MTDTNGNNQELLTEVELKAMEYKFMGFEYAEISTMLKDEYPETFPATQTLKKWFYKEGRLYDAYEKYAKEQAETNVKEASNLWKAHAKKAMRTVITLMSKADKDNVKLSASQEILGRAFGSVPKIVYQPENKDVLDELLKEIGLLENEEEGKSEKNI